MSPHSPVTVALLSDTHGHLDPAIAEHIARSDYAVHAGDIGAAVLESVAPRHRWIAVRGNNDRPGIVSEDVLTLPWRAELPLPGGTLVVVHGHRVTPAATRHETLRKRYPEARAILYGHSHRLVVDQSEIPWVLNPGAAGRSRTFGGPSCLLLRASETEWTIETFRNPRPPRRRPFARPIQTR